MIKVQRLLPVFLMWVAAPLPLYLWLLVSLLMP